MDSPVSIKPRSVSLSEWRRIADGASFSLNRSAHRLVAAGAESVERIVAKGEAVYGINTGFGQLANVRIPINDLEALQRNLVLSHATGVGELMPPEVVRLMMALKLASLSSGASGARPETLQLLEAMAAHNVIPLVPAQGSVGASGDLAPLAHMSATMIGIGEAFHGGERLPSATALQRACLEPVRLAPKEGLALLNGTQFSTAYALERVGLELNRRGFPKEAKRDSSLRPGGGRRGWRMERLFAFG